MLRNALIYVISLFFFIFFTNIPRHVYANIQSQKNSVVIDFFYSPTCPHCKQADIFLEKLKEHNSALHIKSYEASSNSNLLLTMYRRYRVPQKSQGLVPVIFIQNEYFVGFDEKTGKEIKELVEKGLVTKKTSEKTISIPFLGDINPDTYALPVLAIILGALDGFNVCSLGALLMILALVLALKSRSKTLILGGGFIATTAIVYGFLIMFWYKLFSFLSPFMRKMELVIGVLTFIGGIYFLKEFFKFLKYGPACDVGPAQKIEGRFYKIFNSLLHNKAGTLTLLIALFLFALIITVVEFPCSAAVPLVFAGILTKAQLSGFTYLVFISLYILFYMLDELIVFFIAFFTMKLWLAQPKFITWITLLESIILFSLAGYYLLGL